MKVLLVEDDVSIGEGVVAGLSASGMTVDWVQTGGQALTALVNPAYSVVVLDLGLPDLDGLDVLGRARRQGPLPPVLILSARNQSQHRVAGLNQGADDYLVKPFSFAELLARLQAVLRRSGQHREPTAFTVADLTLDLLSHRATRAGRPLELKTNEFVLLEHLMRNKGQIVSRTAIVNLIWGYDPGTNVVEVLMSRLRAKIDKDFEPKLIQTVRGLGYVLRLE